MAQRDIVIKQLKDYGEVDRNKMIREQYITRLGAIMYQLKKEGWEFETEQRDGNYVYKLISTKPKQEVFNFKGELKEIHKKSPKPLKPYYDY